MAHNLIIRSAVVVLGLWLSVASAAAQTGNVVKDGWITMKIHSQFVPEDALEGSNIDVDTVSGVATLSGTVPSDAARARALAIAKGTDGVKSVTDKLQIGPAEKAIDPKMLRESGRTAGRIVTDGWAKSSIYAKFIPEKTLEDSKIDVDILNGVVTLNGTVKSEAGRTRAVEIAKGTAGVKSVKDALKIG
jgi:hyperosmotically inducible periplasmic protein